jgi:polyhydroxybutyrate depolymerase
MRVLSRDARVARAREDGMMKLESSGRIPRVATVLVLLLLPACAGTASARFDGARSSDDGGFAPPGNTGGSAGAEDAAADLVDAGSTGPDKRPEIPSDGAPDSEHAPPPKSGLPGAACGKGIAAPADGYHDIDVGGVARRFILHVPPEYDGTRAAPLILAFHSKGDDATQWDSFHFRFADAAGAANVLVYMEALPDATLMGDRSFERDFADDLSYTDTVLGWLGENVCFDKSRVFAVGHSNGATFVQTLGCRRGDVVRAVAMHAGQAGLVTECKGPVAAFVGYGLLDNAGLVAVGKARRDFWLAADGCAGETTTPGDPSPPCVFHGGCREGYTVESCEDPAGDHKWSDWLSKSVADFFAAL